MLIPYGRQNIDQSDIDAVVEVLQSDFITQGPLCVKFEEAVRDYCGSSWGIAASSATAALHMACASLGVKEGDIVWTSPISFVASSNCALYCGADIDFVDIDGKTYNMCPKALEDKLVLAEKNGTLPKVVIPVHLTGQSCDMKAIHKLSQKYGFKIIEDASHAVGGSYETAKVGSCEYSDICVFSFHPVKIITTGEGGIALTNDHDLAIRMSRFRSHGITRTPDHLLNEPDGEWYYEQLELGANYRMTDIHAALGMSQLNKLDEFVAERNRLAENYNGLFSDNAVTLPYQAKGVVSSFHLYVLRIPEKTEFGDRNTVFTRLRSAGIGVNLHYIPIYRQPYYQKMGFERQNFPQAEAYYKEAISIPLFPGLTEEQQKQIHSLTLGHTGFQTIF